MAGKRQSVGLSRSLASTAPLAPPEDRRPPRLDGIGRRMAGWGTACLAVPGSEAPCRRILGVQGRRPGESGAGA